MDSLQIDIKLIKQTYTLDDGNLCTGVQVIVAPMVYKFISLNNQKLSLLSEIRPKFYQWFMNSPDGSELVLREVPKIPVSDSDSSDFVSE